MSTSRDDKETKTDSLLKYDSSFFTVTLKCSYSINRQFNANAKYNAVLLQINHLTNTLGKRLTTLQRLPKERALLQIIPFFSPGLYLQPLNHILDIQYL